MQDAFFGGADLLVLSSDPSDLGSMGVDGLTWRNSLKKVPSILIGMFCSIIVSKIRVVNENTAVDSKTII